MALSAKVFMLILIVGLIAVGVVEAEYAKNNPHGGEGEETGEEYHVHADFAVVVQGQRLSFTDFRLYQNPVACDDTGEDDHSGEEIQAHLHNGNDKVAHFHAAQASWKDFWEWRNVTLTDGPETCLTLPTGQSWCNDATSGNRWQMVVNGQLSAFNPDTTPQDLDRVLFTYNRPLTQPAASLAFNQVSNDACIYSGTCPERGTAPAEQCA